MKVESISRLAIAFAVMAPTAATAAGDETIDRALAFIPGRMPDGIAAADPMLAVRTAAYPISFGERQ